MKKIYNIVFVLVLVFAACKQGKSDKKENTTEAKATYVSFGNKIDANDALSKDDMGEKFNTMKSGDTLQVKFVTTIDKVCKKKGCWIKVPLQDGKESFVKFKDYAFFMPMNSEGSEVILNGKAFKSEVSVAELQHYAKDAGKSDEEIAKITEPKVTYSFLADGVLLEAKNE